MAFAYGPNSSGQARYITHSDGFTDNVGYVTAGTYGSGSNAVTTVPWVTFDRFAIGQFSGQTVQANGDGGTVVTATASPTTNTALSNGLIGKLTGYGDYWDGVIQQIVIWSGTLSTSDRQSLEGWDSWYTGQAGANLPSNHPYKNAAPTVTTGGTVTTSTGTATGSGAATGASNAVTAAAGSATGSVRHRAPAAAPQRRAVQHQVAARRQVRLGSSACDRNGIRIWRCYR